MALSNHYIRLDENNHNQDYIKYRIYNINSNDVYEIYYFIKNNNYYYHEDENIDLSYKTLSKNFDSLNDILDYVSTYTEDNKLTKNVIIESKNIFNLGKKKQTVKVTLNHQKLNETFKGLVISDVSSEIPKELLSTPNQIFDMIYYELDKINKNHSYKHYYKPLNNSIYNLEMNIFNETVGNFKFNVELDKSAFPLIPPKIKIIEPYLDRKVILQINNLSDLNINCWNPIVSLEYLLLKYAEKVVNLKEYINNSADINIQFEKLNIDLAELCGIKPDDIVDFNLDFSKISLKDTKKSKYWNAGTGYGYEGSDKWDINGFYNKRININKKKTDCLIKIISFFDENPTDFKKYYNESITKKYIYNFLNSINILDFSKNQDVYLNTFKIIDKIVDDDNIIFTNSQLELIKNFFENIKNLCKQDNYDDQKMGLILLILENLIPKIKVEDIISIDIGDDIKKKYCEMVKKNQFGEEEIPAYYHYKNKLSNPNRKSMIRIMSEISSLKNSLPINWDTSILMRINKSNINYTSFFVIGPEGTPYHNGIFEFHMYYPNDYPTSNPLVNLMTNGEGTVRFNPNLYNCGKVCLSLLGTWRGQEGESWNPKISTALQVFISIQSLIFTSEPYFNEPGYERDRGTKKGDKQSSEYSELRRLETIRWAINDKIKNPIKGLEEFTRNHFIMKKEEILKITQSWLNDCSEKHSLQMIEEVDIMIKYFEELTNIKV
tara:strand:+ start:2845 stop:5004 length:2160 start_codon:yes stop_codon:yes gene_type:complete